MQIGDLEEKLRPPAELPASAADTLRRADFTRQQWSDSLSGFGRSCDRRR